MKLSRPSQFLLSLVLTHALILNPLFVPRAMAGLAPHSSSYNEVCGPVDNATPEEAKTNPAVGGPTIKAACLNGKNAMAMWSVELAKTIIFAVAAAACFALICLEWAGTGSICTLISMGVGAAAMITDQIFAKQAQSISDNWASQAQKLVEPATAAAIPLAKTLAKELLKEGTKLSGNAECGIAGGFLAADAVLSGFGMSAAATATSSSVDAARSARDAAGMQMTHPHGMAQNGGQVAPIAPGGIAPTAAGSDCSKSQGDSYLTCINQSVQDPQLSAITSNSQFMGLMNKALGKPLGQFVKDYKGDGSNSSLASYAADGIGLPQLAGPLKGVLDSTKELVASKPELGGGRYKSNNAKTEKKALGGMDFNSIMANLMKQANGGDSKGVKKDDSKSLIYKRLEAMSPERVLESKDISLFDRITNRYNKKQVEPEAEAASASGPNSGSH